MVEPAPDARPSPTELQTSQARYLAYRQAHHEERLATRRRILRWAIRVGTGAFSLALLLPALALRTLTREVRDVTADDLLVYATGDQTEERQRAEPDRARPSRRGSAGGAGCLQCHLHAPWLYRPTKSERAGVYRLSLPCQRVRSSGRRAGHQWPGKPASASPARRGCLGWGRAGRWRIRGAGRTGLMARAGANLPGAPR
jgi:hypothetical protein